MVKTAKTAIAGVVTGCWMSTCSVSQNLLRCMWKIVHACGHICIHMHNPHARALSPHLFWLQCSHLKGYVMEIDSFLFTEPTEQKRHTVNNPRPPCLCPLDSYLSQMTSATTWVYYLHLLWLSMRSSFTFLLNSCSPIHSLLLCSLPAYRRDSHC